MRDIVQQKVSVEQLKRKAYLYVRQSSLRQLIDNQESTKRQYALKQRAVADRKSTRLNSSHMSISYAVFCLTCDWS